MASCFSCNIKKKEARRHLAKPGTPLGDQDEQDGRMLAQFAMRAKMSPVRAEFAQDMHRVVIQDFARCVEDEVAVNRGDCVRELFRDGDWIFVAKNTGQTGFIPASYCRSISALMNVPKQPRTSKTTDSSENSTSHSLRSNKSSTSSMGLSTSRTTLTLDVQSSRTGAQSPDSAMSGYVRRRGAASPSRLVTHGTGVSGSSSSGFGTADNSRAPSRSVSTRQRISLLAALGDEELAKQRTGLQHASGPGFHPQDGPNDLCFGASPDSSDGSLLDSPQRMSRRYSFDSSAGSPLVSPAKSLDSASMLSDESAKSAPVFGNPKQNDIIRASPNPACPRRVTNRGRSSRRTSQDLDRSSPQPSISSLPAVRKQVRLAYNFQASKEGELSLNNGDEVVVIREQGKDWLLVETESGERGLVPACLTITVSAVHVPVHGMKSRMEMTSAPLQRNACSDSSLDLKTAVGNGTDSGRGTGASDGSDQADGGDRRDTLRRQPDQSASPLSSANIVTNRRSPNGRDDRTLTRESVHSDRSYYEDLYSFPNGRSSSPPCGAKRRSHSASRATIHRIDVESKEQQLQSATLNHNSDGEAPSRSGSALGRFFGRRSRRSDPPKPDSKSQQAEAVAAVSEADRLAHGWRNTQPAYHRQRSRSASRTGMNKIDAVGNVDPLPHASTAVTTGNTSVVSHPAKGVQPAMQGMKNIPVGNAAVFTPASTSPEASLECSKQRMRSLTLQPGTRPPAATAPVTPHRTVTHTRAASIDESTIKPPQQRALRVMFDYTAMIAEEMDVKSGSVVMETTSRSKPGWAWVVDPGTGRHGYIPVGFTEVATARRTTTNTTRPSRSCLEAVQVASSNQPRSGELCTTI